MGFSDRMRIVVVSHSYREDDLIIRVISARKATKREQKQYLKR
jgi:uncharacterized protein